MNLSEIKPGDVAKSIEESFHCEQKYVPMRVKSLRKALELIPLEYDECELAFSFMVKDHGDSGNNDGMKNFILGTIPIKCLVRHPDETKVMMCDDRSMDYFMNCTQSATTTIKDEEPEEDEDLGLETCEQCGEEAWDGYICHSCGAKRI